MMSPINALIVCALAASILKTTRCDTIPGPLIFFTSQGETNKHPILSGFVIISGIMMRIKRRLNLSSACTSIKFIGVPKNTTSPLVRGETFKLVLHRLYNGRYAYTNGADYISYSPTSDDSSPYGTWLLGNSPGVDNGYAYLKPTHETLVPLEISGAKWHWLERGSWEVTPATKLICEDSVYSDFSETPKKEQTSNFFYHVEYYVGDSLHTGFYSPSSLTLTKSEIDAMTSAVEPTESKMVMSLLKPALWSDVMVDKISIGSGSNYKIICSIGGPTRITDSLGRTTLAILVQQELSGPTNGWSLTFRRIQGSDSDEEESGWNSQVEIILTIAKDGPLGGYTITPLSDIEELEFKSGMHTTIENTMVGDYLWIHYSPYVRSLSSSSSVNVGLDGSEIVERSFKGELPTKRGDVEEDFDVLLECVGRTNDKILFTYYLSDRRDAMKQSILSKDIHYFTYSLSDCYSNSNDNSDIGDNDDPTRNPVLIDHKNSKIEANSIVFIGSDLIGFIRKYLVYKENPAIGLSSCFLYHAAVSLPQALVYAAEILCVLTGQKAVTMVQYSTSTDHQWKFPLVSELSRSIVQTKLLLGDAFDVEYRVFEYKNDESLVFYRTNRTYVADSLVPFEKTQALHPVPYPDGNNPVPDYEMQIYNSWWNGYALGYPERFVQSYCETFHNDLSPEQKHLQIEKAKRDSKAYMKRIKQPVALIGMGLEPPVSDLAWETVISQI